MAKYFAVLALCGLVAAASGATLQRAEQQALIAKQYAHLQVEIDEWHRLGHPTEVEFAHIGNQTVGASLTALPTQAPIFGWNTDYASNIFYYLFTRENPEGTQVTKNVKELTAAGWKSSRPTKIIIHGFGNTIKSDLFTIVIPDLLKNGDFNVIGVDWGKLAKKPFYVEARNRVAGVGGQVATLVDFLVSNSMLNLDDLHVIGHSLGAHAAGNVGKKVKSGDIARITGLDPAMPLFLILKSDRLTKNDARTVDVVHTCINLLGLQDSIGDVDFYPNGGKHPQPGCGVDLIGSCSHGRSYHYFGESAVERDAFQASLCTSTSDAVNEECDAADAATATMGIDLKFEKTGAYYLKTADSPPYDLGTRAQLTA